VCLCLRGTQGYLKTDATHYEDQAVVVDVYSQKLLSTKLVGRVVLPVSELLTRCDLQRSRGQSKQEPCEAATDQTDSDASVNIDTQPPSVVKMNAAPQRLFLLDGWFSLLTRAGRHSHCGEVFISISANGGFASVIQELLAAPWRRQRQSSALPKQLAALPPAPEEILVFAGTWNVGNTRPDTENLGAFIDRKTGYDVYVVGTQENQYSTSVSPESPMGSAFQNSEDDWHAMLMAHLGGEYCMVKKHSLWSIRICVFAKKTLMPYINNVRVAEKATGIGNVLGNKGSVCISMAINHTSLIFLSSHFAAHQDMTVARNSDYAETIKDIRFGERIGDKNKCVTILDQFDFVVWMGDFNYRIGPRYVWLVCMPMSMCVCVVQCAPFSTYPRTTFIFLYFVHIIIALTLILKWTAWRAKPTSTRW
jgi:hypothetical protein